jgi:glutathione S-transferase
VYLQKDYILGSKPSIGDLLAYEEIAQLKTTSFDLHGFPAIKAWMARLEELPEYEKPHKILLAVVQKASPKL